MDQGYFTFAPEDSSPKLEKPAQASPWLLLVVDDDPEVHQITRMSLQDYAIEGRKLRIESAYSAAEAREFLKSNSETAVVLLDVVMETDNAGLELVEWIRKDWKNTLIRIILRTGQPGAAPEKHVITTYSINDYKAKTELTELKLFTSVTVAIRSYQDLKMIQRSEEGFKRIVEASRELFRNRSREQFYSGVLLQLSSLLRLDEDSLFLQSDGLALQGRGDTIRVLAKTGIYQEQITTLEFDWSHPVLAGLVGKARNLASSFFQGSFYVGYFLNETGQENILILHTTSDIPPMGQELIKVFAGNIAMAFNNLELNDRIEETQRKIIITLSEFVEGRFKETGNHVHRVGAMAGALARQLGMDSSRAEALATEATMHDVGKVGMSDHILKKPGPLSEDEILEMRTHTILGWEILRGGGDWMAGAAVIARHHHERWDGHGYPDGLKGEEIPLPARITAVADVYDALSHFRIYKSAWDEENVEEYLKANSGTQFDPAVVQAFFSIKPEILAICAEYQD